MKNMSETLSIRRSCRNSYKELQKDIIQTLCVALGFSILSALGKSSFAQNHAQNFHLFKGRLLD
jgi:hypothetical protein